MPDDAPPPTPSPTLEYAPGAPAVWRRPRVIRRAVATALLLAVALAAYHFGPGLWARYDAARQYRACLAAYRPPGTLAYSEDPADVARLRKDRRYQTASYQVQKPGAVNTPFTGLRPTESYTRLSPYLFGGTDFVSRELFLHERKTTAGAPRLIQVAFAHTLGTTAIITVHEIARASFPRAAGRPDPGVVCLRANSPALDFAPLGGVANLRLLTGRPDPADPTRFTIPFQTATARGLIEGRFVPNPSGTDDEVKLRVLPETPTTPATTRAAPD